MSIETLGSNPLPPDGPLDVSPQSDLGQKGPTVQEEYNLIQLPPTTSEQQGVPTELSELEQPELSKTSRAYKAGYFVGKILTKYKKFGGQAGTAIQLGSEHTSTESLDLASSNQDEPVSIANSQNKAESDVESSFGQGSGAEIITGIPDHLKDEAIGRPNNKEAEPLGDISPEPEVTASLEKEFSAQEAARLIIERGYAIEASDVTDQSSDTERNNIIKHVPVKRALWNNDPTKDDPVEELTEQESLKGLVDFLETFILEAESQGRITNTVESARDMLENLTYIGEKEYGEATKAIAAYWKTFLDEDPSRQICVLTKIAEVVSSGSKVKSDKYLLNRILENFTDEEIEQYGDRLITELHDIDADPEDVKVILLDDWTISGSQLRSAYSAITGHPEFSKFAKQVEINLIAASPDRIENGLEVGGAWEEDVSGSVPVKAYIKAHKSSKAKRSDAVISGSHSSVDYDFETTLESMVTEHMFNTGKPTVMPPTSNIVRRYRYAPLPRIEKLNDRRKR